MKNEKGFTLVEMLVVLLVISILLLITIPNIASHNNSIKEKGCEGLKDMIQGQVLAYEMEHNETPTMQDLIDKEYVQESASTCPNGDAVTIENGVVK
ncbi:competence type IV pilus major pilin ComGC [Bacillus sp. FJAT-47783]|uniref:competence type IV pilus major pilin ComGC n=1 Tax=Bacillus sp. FJAT-47783 TaxID=2922712 RepID=UPI001FAD4334|nr:competence type IV pilus major pilin ComGC [Bacillus sp. FJAT-47783]